MGKREIESPPLAPAMSPTVLGNCRSLARISEYAHRFLEQCKLDERGRVLAFGMDMDNPAHAEWLADIRDDLLIVLHRAERIGGYAPGGREFDERGPR